MTHKWISAATVAALLLAPVAAYAAHGRPGLWKITSTTQIPNMPQMPPEMMARMKARGMPMPGQPLDTQICMTPEEVNMDHPPAMDRDGQSCTSKVLSQSATSVTTEVTCHGKVEGKGRSQVSWRGTDHYQGTYVFRGSMEGKVQQISTSYTGDFVKSDCGAVKPMVMPKKP
jgi:uncharacterized protein DUF3617